MQVATVVNTGIQLKNLAQGVGSWGGWGGGPTDPPPPPPEPNCIETHYDDGNQCVQNCEDGYTDTGDMCVPDVADCGAGYTNTGNECQLLPERLGFVQSFTNLVTGEENCRAHPTDPTQEICSLYDTDIQNNDY
jgi:hypothetical protein